MQKLVTVIELKTKGLFSDEHKLEGTLGLSQDEIYGLDIKVSFTVEEDYRNRISRIRSRVV